MPDEGSPPWLNSVTRDDEIRRRTNARTRNFRAAYRTKRWVSEVEKLAIRPPEQGSRNLV
jgi:hypothetical protein